MEPIYSVKQNLESAKQRLRNSTLPDNVKDKIFEFVDVLREGSGIREHRQYFYYERLLILSDVLGGKILNPSKQDVLKAISELRDRTTIRHASYSPSTISDFKKVLKKFVKYVNDGELPKFWNDINAEKIRSRYSAADQMITYDELQSLLSACKNQRDKALISLLWDSGIRASELLKLRIKDFQKSSDGLYATLNIQEGSKNYKQRTVILTGDSVVLVPEYLEYLKNFLKDRFSEDRFLFIGIGKEKPGENLTYDDLRSVIQKIAKRSGIQKPISPHLFRHSAATRMASESLPVQVFTKQMGWSSNKMADNYTHLDSKSQIKAILKAQGIPITDEELKKPLSKVNRRCPRCHIINTGSARFCSNCGSPMRSEDFVKVEEERLKVMDTLKESDLISSELQATMDNLPDDSKLDLLASLLLKLEKDGKLDVIKKRVKK
jgi:site-specific recombinase XerD